MPRCPVCNKEVYFDERVTSLGKDWHWPCLEHEKCGKTPTSGRGIRWNMKAGPAMRPCSDPKVLGMVEPRATLSSKARFWKPLSPAACQAAALQTDSGPSPQVLGFPAEPHPSINLDPWEKKKWIKDLNMGLSEEDIQMTNNHMKNAQLLLSPDKCKSRSVHTH